MDRYWEMFNKINGDFDDVAISTFKVSLSVEHGLRKSLTGKPVTSVHQLMDRIDKYKKVEEDQQHGKGKAKVIPQERRGFKSDWYNNNRPQRDFAGQPGPANTQMVNAVFREPVHQVLETIKNRSFFKWLNKMAGNPMRRNQSLYFQYYQDQGHITQDCRNLWDHLDQLVREGKLKQLLHHSSGLQGQANSEPRRDASSRPPLGMINDIFTTLGRTSLCPSIVMSMAQLSVEDTNPGPKRAKVDIQPALNFSDKDKIGTIQPHDDTLAVTLKIGGYDVKRVMVDQGSGVEIMYLDLYKGLNLRLEDLTTYDSPLVSFDGKVVILRG